MGGTGCLETNIGEIVVVLRPACRLLLAGLSIGTSQEKEKEVA